MVDGMSISNNAVELMMSISRNAKLISLVVV